MLQTLQLGILGSEEILQSESRTFNSTGIREFIREGRSINGTLHVDYINTKKNFSISWDTLRQADLDTIESIFQSQFLNGVFINFIVSDKTGATTNYTVKMAPFNWANKAYQDDWYYSGVVMSLEEV